METGRKCIFFDPTGKIMENIKKRLASLDLLTLVRWMLLTEMVALLVSTSLAVGTELVIYLLFTVSPLLRSKLWQARRQPWS